jgi:hypothetical protein
MCTPAHACLPTIHLHTAHPTIIHHRCHPTALLQRAVDANGTFKVEVVVQMRQSPMQRDVVRQLLPQAEASWWSPGHIGWTIFPADTDSFEVGMSCVMLLCYMHVTDLLALQ